MKSRNKPVIALTLGDASGIGSELVGKLLIEKGVKEQANIVIVGDRWQLEEGLSLANAQLELTKISDFSDAIFNDISFFETNTIEKEDRIFSSASGKCGAAVLQALRICMDAGLSKQVDAITFAPLNKYAMKLGGLSFEDELHFFADYLNVTGYFCEFNTLGNLWTSRISSHIPLKEAYKYITIPRIVAASELIYSSLQKTGIKEPKVAVAAFNPHGGEGGTCGKEEVEIIVPAVKALNRSGFPIQGPFPADTIFIHAQNEEYDAVVTMYHDQGQIAIKLLGFSQGVTVQGGLPIPITTPAHGTAFDIAGKGIANVGPMRNAFDIACKMGRSRLQNR